jgi:phospholipid/cholesterol/gamma-HCH transport system substrate-binding protein
VSARKRTRRHKPWISSVWAGILALLAIAAVTYLVFGGSLPFAGKQFVLKAVFTSNTEIHIPSPVRIAGVDVGEVTSVTKLASGSDAGLVTMTIDPSGLPIHADATATIRERIFLEGNVYVDLHPGAPSSPILGSGATLPAANTSGPVQLNRILSSLTASSRANLQTLVRGLGASLNQPPTPQQDASQDPSVRGLTGGQALNASLKYSTKAFEASAIVNQALLGTEPGDLSGVVAGASRVFRGFAASQAQLEGLITTFNSTMSALAARQQQLEATIATLPPLLRNTQSADTALDASFAPTQAFARKILPGIKILDPTIGDSLPWISQLTALVSREELGALLKDLTPAVRDTSSSLSSTDSLVSGSNELAKCLIHNVIPTGNSVIQDPPLTTGLQVYQELFQSAVGIAGASQNFDGNGRYVRASVGGGSDQIVTKTLPLNGPLFGNAVLAPLGTRPAFPASAPPIDRNVPCYKNPAPNLNSAATGTGP